MSDLAGWPSTGGDCPSMVRFLPHKSYRHHRAGPRGYGDGENEGPPSTAGCSLVRSRIPSPLSRDRGLVPAPATRRPGAAASEAIRRTQPVGIRPAATTSGQARGASTLQVVAADRRSLGPHRGGRPRATEPGISGQPVGSRRGRSGSARGLRWTWTSTGEPQLHAGHWPGPWTRPTTQLLNCGVAAPPAERCTSPLATPAVASPGAEISARPEPDPGPGQPGPVSQWSVAESSRWENPADSRHPHLPAPHFAPMGRSWMRR